MTDYQDEKQSTASYLDEHFTVHDLPKFSHPEWGENPDPLTEEQKEILYRYWDELGEKLGIPEHDAKVRQQLSLNGEPFQFAE